MTAENSGQGYVKGESRLKFVVLSKVITTAIYNGNPGNAYRIFASLSIELM